MCGWGEVSKVSTHLWMGLMRLGGYIGNNDITPQMHSQLVDQNNELLTVANTMRLGVTRGRNDTPTHAVPTPDDEHEDFEEESASESGAPRSVMEPEPHAVREEKNLPGHEPEMEAVPVKLIFQIRQPCRQLGKQMEEAALVGDERGAESLHLQLRNVESLQLSLPRHTST